MGKIYGLRDRQGVSWTRSKAHLGNGREGHSRPRHMCSRLDLPCWGEGIHGDVRKIPQARPWRTL